MKYKEKTKKVYVKINKAKSSTFGWKVSKEKTSGWKIKGKKKKKEAIIASFCLGHYNL